MLFKPSHILQQGSWTGLSLSLSLPRPWLLLRPCGPIPDSLWTPLVRIRIWLRW